MPARTVSFCCARGPYVITVNHAEGGTIISIARRDPLFSVTMAVNDVCVGCDVQRGDAPPDRRLLDRVMEMEESHGETG